MNKKLLTYFLLLFLAVAMPSCSNDNDEPESSVKDLIVGVWKYNESDDVLKLKVDGTYILIDGDDGQREYGTYLIHKSSLYNQYILTLINDKQNTEDDVLAFQIVRITKNKLVLRFEGYFEGDDPDDETTGFTRME